jgi:hypothetical protein
MPETNETVEDRVARLTAEGLISLTAAAPLLGSYRRGRPTHPATLARHCLTGCVGPDGVRRRLEHLRVSGRLMTTRPAVLRYLAAQQPPDAGDPPPAPRPPAARARASARADEELRRLGL